MKLAITTIFINIFITPIFYFINLINQNFYFHFFQTPIHSYVKRSRLSTDNSSKDFSNATDSLNAVRAALSQHKQNEV